jgi:AraC-like DNA-binding protein
MAASHTPAGALAHSALSVRRYAGEYAAHAHAHAQVLLGLTGRLELEIGGRCTYVDPSCGVVIPPGVDHGFMAPLLARVLVVDAPQRTSLQRFKRFSLTPGITALAGQPDAAERIVDAATLGPSILARRGLDLASLLTALDDTLHQDWSTARMAALCALSPQRFHARVLELTGMTPQRLLRVRRLDRAGQLLQAGHSLESTALRVGYRSGSALAFALRRDRGCPAGLV